MSPTPPVNLAWAETELTQSIPDFPYHKYVELLGLKGIFVDDPDKIGAAWDELDIVHPVLGFFERNVESSYPVTGIAVDWFSDPTFGLNLGSSRVTTG